MGLFDKLVNVLGLKKKECNVLIVGLDNSGKSTLLNHFKPEEQRQGEIVPTVGFNVEKFKSRNSAKLVTSLFSHSSTISIEHCRFVVFRCCPHPLLRTCAPSSLFIHTSTSQDVGNKVTKFSCKCNLESSNSKSGDH